MFSIMVFCAVLIFVYFHYFYDFPYISILGLGLAWVIYKIVKFISIRNKKLFIKKY